MAKLDRKLMKPFGSTALLAQSGKFGSKAAGSPATTLDIEEIQSLSNWLSGWYTAVISGNSPCIEDMNSMCKVFGYQLAYIMQAGIPEWNADTTYYIGSLVNSGGIIFRSVQNTNTNHAVTDGAWWISSNGKVVNSPADYQILANDKLVIGNCTVAAANITQTLPDATLVTGFAYEITKDSADASGFSVIIATLNTQTINSSSTISLVAPGEFITVRSDGSNWIIVSRG